ncbi:MAG: peptidylprolyl isomerase [Kiloniellales bacterium]
MTLDVQEAQTAAPIPQAAVGAAFRVNGELVSQSAIAAETQHHPVAKGQAALAWRRAAEALALRSLLLQEARRRGLSAEPQQLGPGRSESEEEALIRALLEQAVAVEAPSEAEIRAEWARGPERFRSAPLWEASHILCACDPNDPAAADQALNRAIALTGDVLADPAAFPRLAKQHSDCSSKASGGSLGQLRPGDTLPDFEAALRRLKEGEITATPIASPHGYHVIRMDALAEGQVLPFEAVAPKIATALEKLAWARAAKAFGAALLARAEITAVGKDGQA